MSKKELYNTKRTKSLNDKKLLSKKSEETKDKDKFMKLRIHGKETKVKYEDYMNVKNLDKQKLQATKDSMIQMMKRKVEFHKKQLEVYNMQVLAKISDEREEELRGTVVNLQNEIRKKRKREKSEIEMLYKLILVEVNKIYEKIQEEIDSRKSELMDRIMLSIANCDYKQNLLLEAKIKEQEEFFRNLHMFTFEMQQIKENFNESVQKIKDFTQNNFDLKKNILQEKLKFYHITTVMKEFKRRNNYMVNKIMEYKASTHTSNFKESSFKNKNNKNEHNLLIDINNSNNIKTTSNNTHNKLMTNSTHYLTKNNKTESNEENYKKNSFNNIINTEYNDNFHKRNFETNIIATLKKENEYWKNKLIILVKKYKETIPDNKIYSSIIEIIEALKRDKSNKFFGEVEDDNLIDRMMTLPVQNKQFRVLFLELLFRNKNIFDAIRRGQKNDLDKYFQRNIFGAEKIKK